MFPNEEMMNKHRKRRKKCAETERDRGNICGKKRQENTEEKKCHDDRLRTRQNKRVEETCHRCNCYSRNEI